MNNEKVLERIRKLFALGSNNTNENEAKLAIKTAKKLLDKHNFSMYDLKKKDDVGIKIEDYVSMPWTRIVYGSVSRLFDSKYLIRKEGRKTQHLIIGTESNRVTASIVIRHVLSQIRNEFVGMGNGVRNSAAVAVRDNVNAILAERNASRQEVIPGTGLVPMGISMLMKKDIQKWVDKFLGEVEEKKTQSVVGNSKGRAFGSKINLGVQISNKRALN